EPRSHETQRLMSDGNRGRRGDSHVSREHGRAGRFRCEATRRHHVANRIGNEVRTQHDAGWDGQLTEKAACCHELGQNPEPLEHHQERKRRRGLAYEVDGVGHTGLNDHKSEERDANAEESGTQPDALVALAERTSTHGGSWLTTGNVCRVTASRLYRDN